MGDSKKNVGLLIVLLIVFAIIFFISLAGIENQEVLFDIGIPLFFENLLITLLSLGSIIKIVWELYRA